MAKLGASQKRVLGILRGTDKRAPRCYPGGWVHGSHFETVRILDSLVRRGLASKDDHGVYRAMPETLVEA